MSARDDLIQYRFLLSEVERLQSLIDDLEIERKQLIQMDSVHGSETEFPYTMRKIKINGIDFSESEASELNEEYRKLIHQLRAKRLQSKRAYLRAMSYIYEAPDPITRRALELKYINGMTWIQVASEIDGNSPDSLRMMCRAYLAKK